MIEETQSEHRRNQERDKNLRGRRDVGHAAPAFLRAAADPRGAQGYAGGR